MAAAHAVRVHVPASNDSSNEFLLIHDEWSQAANAPVRGRMADAVVGLPFSCYFDDTGASSDPHHEDQNTPPTLSCSDARARNGGDGDGGERKCLVCCEGEADTHSGPRLGRGGRCETEEEEEVSSPCECCRALNIFVDSLDSSPPQCHHAHIVPAVACIRARTRTQTRKHDHHHHHHLNTARVRVPPHRGAGRSAGEQNARKT